jgi:hypothetical protein
MEVVYSAFGGDYIREAAISAWSVKRHIPGAFTSIVTDTPFECKFFDQIKVMKPVPAGVDASRVAKIHKAVAILASLSETVLYLDTDTYVTADLSDLPSALYQHDLAMALDTWRFEEIFRLLHPEVPLASYPGWHPFFNAGVVVVKRSARTDTFIAQWMHEFTSDARLVRDQVVLRRLLYNSDIRVRVLPPEYNVRCIEPIHISGKMRILHGRASIDHWPHSLPFLADFLGTETRNRVYTPRDGRLVTLRDDYSFPEKRLEDHVCVVEREEFINPPIRW